MRFDARPVVPRRFSLKKLGLAASVGVILALAVSLSVQYYFREKAVAKEEAEQLARRLFYVAIPGRTLRVPASDVNDRLIASLVIDARRKTDVQFRIDWLDDDGQRLASRAWRRPVAPDITPIGDDSMERYLSKEGSALAGPRQMTLRRDDFPAGTHEIAFTLDEPVNIPVYVRFYTRAQLQPGATHQELALLERRERRLEARTALPSSLAPQELLDRLTGWKWVTIAAEGNPEPKTAHLFRRDVKPQDEGAEEEGEPERVPGLRLAPGKPLAFAIEQAGAYELRIVEGFLDLAGEVEVEKRVPGRLPEVARVRTGAGERVWRDVVPAPATLAVRKLRGGPVEVRMVLDAEGAPEMWAQAATAPSVAWLVGPAETVEPMRALASAVPPRPDPQGDALRFAWSAGAAEQGPTLRLRVRAVHASGEAPPTSVRLAVRIGGAGKLALADERVTVALAPPDLERVPNGWSPPMPDEVRPGEERPTFEVTGPGDLFVEIPEEGRLVEVKADAPVLILASHTLPAMRPTIVVQEETPDRTLCYVEAESGDDARTWHYLRPSNEEALRKSGGAVVVDLPSARVQAPLRGATSADAVWDRETAEPSRHAGSAIALWPARPRGAIAASRLFPWSAPWPSGAYRPLEEGEVPPPVLLEPGLPDPADVLAARADGVLERVLWVSDEWPERAKWINRPPPGEALPDPRHADVLRRAWRAMPEVPAVFEVTHDGVETWVSLNAQFEGDQPALLDIDILPPPWATRKVAWSGARTDRARRIAAGFLPEGPSPKKAVFIEESPALAGGVFQHRIRLGPDLGAGDYVVRVRPTAQAVWLSAGVSRMGGRAYQNGTAWTFVTEGLGGRRLGLESPGRDPSRDLVLESVVPGRSPSQLFAEPAFDRWTVAIPSDCVALRIRCVAAGPGPLLVTLERPGAPKPHPLSPSETRDDWRQLLPGIHDTYRSSGLQEEHVRFRLLWEAPDAAARPPIPEIEYSIGLAEGRVVRRALPRWLRDPRTFDSDEPAALLWTTSWIEADIPAGGRDIGVQVMSEGYWIRWERRAGPPAHVALHTQGSLEFFPHDPFLTRTRRATGLYDEEPHPDYAWPVRVTWSTPWEYSEGPTEEHPDLPLIPSDLTLFDASEQFELARPAPWRDPDRRFGPLWRQLPLGADTVAIVGDTLGRARFGSLRFSFQDVDIAGERAASVDVFVDGALRLSETLFRARGELTLGNLPAGKHTVLVRPAAGVPAYRCGNWRVRTIDVPVEGDWQISTVWKFGSSGEVTFEVPAPREGEAAIVEILATGRDSDRWSGWRFRWEIPVNVGGAEVWVPASAERHWIAPRAGAEGLRWSADGAAWTPVFRMAWDMSLLKGHARARGRLFGPVMKGDAVHVFKMGLEAGTLSDVDEVRKR